MRPPVPRRPRQGRARQPAHASRYGGGELGRVGGRPRTRGVRRRRDRRRRRRAAGLHLRHDRQAQGDHALPPRRARHRRHVLPARAQADPDDVFTGTPPLAFTFGLGGLVVFPLRAGASTLLIEKATPDELVDHVARAPGDRPVHRADRLPRDPADAGQTSTCRRCAGASRRARRCPPAVGGVPRGDRRQDHRRHRRDRDAAHLHLRRRRRHPARLHRPAVPGFIAAVLDADGQPRAGRRDRPARGQGPDRLPLPRRPAAAGRTSRTAGTSPATPTSATPTATSGSRPAATT